MTGGRRTARAPRRLRCGTSFDEARLAWDALADGNLGEADTLAKALMAKVAEVTWLSRSDAGSDRCA